LTTSPQLIQLNLPAPSSEKRASDLSANDAFLASLIDLLPKQNYTVLYMTTRSADGMVVAQGKEPLEYDMESQLQESLHLDLKRDLGVHALANKTGNNQTMIDGPLFDKYQFFTPGTYLASLLSDMIMHNSPYAAFYSSPWVYADTDGNSFCRNLHGLSRRLPPPVDAICRHFRRGKSPGHIRGVR
jgi:hypothetical protein